MSLPCQHSLPACVSGLSESMRALLTGDGKHVAARLKLEGVIEELCFLHRKYGSVEEISIGKTVAISFFLLLFLSAQSLLEGNGSTL